MMLPTNTHGCKLAGFILLSCADLGLTWTLLHFSDGYIREGNPIANWWLTRFGWPGLAAFKVVLVALVCLLTLIVARSRPQLGGSVLTFGCVALAVVVGYSGVLLRRHVIEGRPPALADHEWRELQRRQQWMERESWLLDNYRAARAQASSLLEQAEGSLMEAVARLAEAERFQEARWRQRVQERFPGRSFEESLAAQLIHDFLRSRQHEPRLQKRLYQEYQSSYGTPLPQPSDSADFSQTSGNGRQA